MTISQNPLVTVFTPTYNRKNTIHRVWDSLLCQTYRNFEWLVVDDASTDGTETLVRDWIKGAPFPVRYERMARNGGKHTAWNCAARIARGELLVCLDSDDACTPNAIDFFVAEWRLLAERAGEFAYVAVLCSDQNGTLRGNRFPQYRTESDHLEIHWRYGTAGDKWECYRTQVFREFPMPEPDRSGAVPEGIVLARMAKKYHNMYVNEILRIYFNDGVGTSIVTSSDPRKHAWGKFLFASEMIWAYPEWHARAPKAFALMALRVNREIQLLHLPRALVTTHLKTARSRLIVRLFELPGRFIAALERIFTKNLAGRVVH